MNKLSKGFIILFLFFSGHSMHAQGLQVNEAFQVLEKLNASYQCPKISEDEFISSDLGLRFSEGLEAAVYLWKNGGRDEVELAWWRTNYRTTRMLILCLYYGTYKDMDIDFIPRFRSEANRFQEQEKKQRIQEIDYVEKNLEKIKQSLNKILNNCQNQK